jgi:hypothetical protein
MREKTLLPGNWQNKFTFAKSHEVVAQNFAAIAGRQKEQSLLRPALPAQNANSYIASCHYIPWVHQWNVGQVEVSTGKLLPQTSE